MGLVYALITIIFVPQTGERENHIQEISIPDPKVKHFGMLLPLVGSELPVLDSLEWQVPFQAVSHPDVTPGFETLFSTLRMAGPIPIPFRRGMNFKISFTPLKAVTITIFYRVLTPSTIITRVIYLPFNLIINSLP